jgi:DNA helicase-2/ATP-dependent DNA helicase PcrA
LRKVAQIKGSLKFKQVLDQFAVKLARRGISRMSFEKLPGVSKDQVREWLAGDSKEPVNQQISRMLRRLRNQFGFVAQVETAWHQVDALKVYTGLVSRPEVLANVAKDLLTADEVSAIASSGATLTDVDIAPLMHLTKLIDGWHMENVRRPGHVLVDEAEDLTPCELSVLFDLANHASFTLVGDLGQSVFSYRSPDKWQNLIEGVFGYRKTTRANLLHSYRSTAEITTLANAVQTRHQRADGVLAIPVERHGEKPLIKALSSKAAWADALVQSVQNALETYTSVGVLAKDVARCRAVARVLTKANLSPHLLLNSKSKFHSGLVVLPVYVARGLEFDAVVVSDAQEDVYTDTVADATLLYVAVTRPRHSLVILAQGNLTSLIPM